MSVFLSIGLLKESRKQSRKNTHIGVSFNFTVALVNPEPTL